MKKVVFLMFFVIIANMGFGQNSKVYKMMGERYDSYKGGAGLNGGFIVKKNGKYGACDIEGKEVMPCQFDVVEVIAWSPACYFKVKDGGSDFGIYSQSAGKVIIPIGKYKDISIEKTPGTDASVDFKYIYYFKVKNSDDLCGVCDWNGKEVLPCIYKSINDGRATKNGQYLSLKSFNVTSFDYKTETINIATYDAVKEYANFQKEYAQKKAEEEVRAKAYAETKAKDDAEAARIEAAKFSVFAKKYVETKINTWQQKGEYEKTVDWQQRVNETTRAAKAAELLKDAEKAYIEEHSKNFQTGNLTLDKYDADNEVYLVKTSESDNWLVPVPINEAQNFKNNWNSFKRTPKYVIINDKLTVAEMTFTATNGKIYKYSNQASLNYTVAQINYNFAPINIDVASLNQTNPQGNQNISTVNLAAGGSQGGGQQKVATATKSDVDINIPVNTIKNDKTFAVIIANENYQEVDVVEFAKNDGAIFKEYCHKTLGLPEHNVHYKPDATLNNIRAEINWLRQVAEKFNGEANIIFYYAGHGIPDENSKTSYLLPIDGYGTDVATAYKLDDLYQTLGNIPTKSVIIFMDACFSGVGRDGRMIAQARGVAIKAKQGVPIGNTVVFSSSQDDETSLPYREKEHGLFTYVLLKKLQETKGDITLGELGKYVINEVGQKSVVINRKSQTPAVIPSTSLSNWENLKLK